MPKSSTHSFDRAQDCMLKQRELAVLGVPFSTHIVRTKTYESGYKTTTITYNIVTYSRTLPNVA